MLSQKFKKRVLMAAAPVIIAAGISAAPAPAQANGIADMAAAVTAIEGVKDAAIPIAVAVIVFGSGALVLKRLIYA